MSLENIPEINKYLKEKDPSHDEIIKAYSIRDEYYGINFEDVKNQVFDKLGISKKSLDKNLMYESRQNAINMIDAYMKNKQETNIIDLSEIFSNNTEDRIERIARAKERRERLESIDNIKEFYSEFSIDELSTLGW